jgi:hypothetical protein
VNTHAPGGTHRLAFRVGEAAEALGVSPDFFARYVSPELRWVRRGAVKLVSREELEAWLRRSGDWTLQQRSSSRDRS